MKLSSFARRFSADCGILNLMDDLGNALANGEDDLMMLGGGNPSHIPAVTAVFRRQMQSLLETSGSFERLIGNYDPPQGNTGFTRVLARLFRERLGWDVGPENIAITNGSQSAFFALFNLFAGPADDGRQQHILLPLAPEYIGYGDLGLADGLFRARRPLIEKLPDRLFKYRVDFDSLAIDDDTGAVCVSRPTNPTGNVLTDDEVTQLLDLTAAHEIPLILDGAYGTPFPDIIFTDATPFWRPHAIVCLSLSKLGLPGARTGIVVASEAVIRLLTAVNAVLNLATGNLGAILTTPLMESGELLQLSREHIKPYYQERMQKALQVCRQAFDGLDYHIHRPEGAMFLWLWFPGLPIHSQQLYQRLKQRGVLVVAGHHFFPGLEQKWRHRQECLRVTYTQDEAVVKRGIQIIAEEVARAFTEHPSGDGTLEQGVRSEI